MKPPNTKQALLILFVTYSIINFSAVDAALYNYSIGGFSGGARLNDGTQAATYSDGWISGTFVGEDTTDAFGNPGADGIISGVLGRAPDINENEISQLSIAFGGNPVFDALEGGALDLFYISYDIRNNIFSLGYDGDFAISQSYVEELTGDLYTVAPIGFLSVGINRGAVPSAFFSNTIFNIPSDSVYDPVTGNIVDFNKIFSNVSLSSNEQTIVSQAPLPGALLFFASGIGGLGVFRRFSRNYQSGNQKIIKSIVAAH